MFRGPTATDIANINKICRGHLFVHISTVKLYHENMKYQELAADIQVLFDTIKNLKEKLAKCTGLVIVNETHKCIVFY